MTNMWDNKEKEIDKITVPTLIERWKGKQPIFWAKIQNIAIKVGISAVSVLGVDKIFELQSYGIPQIVFTIAGYVIVACATLGLAAKITKQP